MIAVLPAEASASSISGGALIGSSPEMSTTSSGKYGGGNEGVGAAGDVDTSTIEAVKAPGDDPREATSAEATGVEATGAEVTGVGAAGGVGALEGLEITGFTIVVSKLRSGVTANPSCSDLKLWSETMRATPIDNDTSFVVKDDFDGSSSHQPAYKLKA
ncbi:hypothetical protein PsorP6_014225 [Peronosclerospora sorghi]|uniref:Uncharacterized protein n=1 Tax=Peronosclerospora sorghi TaxID=230839 RepID=A0ACC0VIA1_9STRA|nr:hypothetical protein PsorP6_014225 [Peronosclerospora sorghi]